MCGGMHEPVVGGQNNVIASKDGLPEYIGKKSKQTGAFGEGSRGVREHQSSQLTGRWQPIDAGSNMAQKRAY